MFHNIQIDLLILKTYYGQFTLTTKKSLHIIFNAEPKHQHHITWTPTSNIGGQLTLCGQLTPSTPRLRHH